MPFGPAGRQLALSQAPEVCMTVISRTHLRVPMSLVVASMTSSFACAQQPSTWTLASLSGPVSRSNAAMCFFPSAHSAILFGGVGFNNVLTNQDTWFWFGGSWLPLTLPNAPPARHSAAMVLDPPHHRLLMMGGLGASNFLNDTWQFKL